MSSMSLAAIGTYGLVLLACLFAAFNARKFPDRPGDLLHWAAAGATFLGLGILRLINGEDRLRDLGRGLSKDLGGYSDRLSFQIPLAIGVALIGLLVVWVFASRWLAMPSGSRGRLVLVSRYAVLAVVPLYALRLISLHQTDRLLYSGPLRINWLLEGSICLAVGLSALLYARAKGRIKKLRAQKKRVIRKRRRQNTP